MAQDSDLPKAADKGKGKAVENDPKADESQKDKAGQPAANGKKDDGKEEGMYLDPAFAIAKPKLLLTNVTCSFRRA